MKISKNKGFTLIEVVIVLALAAFIFTIIFFAVPQLQRALRDNQRNQDASRIMAELINYASANDGNFPNSQSSLNTFNSQYLGSLTLQDPTTKNNYSLGWRTNTSKPTALGQVYVANRKCNGSTGFSTSPSVKGDIAVLMLRDNKSSFICRDNT